MSRTLTSRVLKCRNAKTQKGASLGMLNIGISVTGRWSDKDPSTSGVPKCRNVKTQKGTSLGMLNIGTSVTGRWSDKDPSSSGVLKCRKSKRRNSRSRHIIPGFQIPRDGEVRDSQHQESRSAEIRNPENRHIKKPCQQTTSAKDTWHNQAMTSVKLIQHFGHM
jgi:hypothetical protein